jgi:predicted dehydrogenase
MDKDNLPKTGGDTRRSFIKKAATAAAAVATTPLFKTPVYGQNQAPSTGRVIGANDRIVVGFVGVGNQGLNSHLKPMLQNAQANNIAIGGVCDVSKHRLEEAKQAGGGVPSFDDYRKLLDQKDIDAVVCATVDHWHATVSIAALKAGKHIYVEKPMSRYLGEAFDVYDTVKSTGKVFQVGSQGCSDMKWHKAAEWIQAGKIGPVVMSQGSYMRNTPAGEWNQYKIQAWCTPEDINWMM